MTIRDTAKRAVQKALEAVDATTAAARKTSATIRAFTVETEREVVPVPLATPEEGRAAIARAHAVFDEMDRVLRNHKNGKG